MTDGKFKYDIAFSFSVKDEAIALALNDKLQDRFKTFTYTEHQKVLAGRNGEDVLSKVYGTEARLAVILFRSEWGTTPFTQIEERAIRNRAFEKTYNFTFFIATEPGVRLPEWLERSRLYYGLERFGLDGAAGAIESKLMELGADPKVESVADRAARLERSLKFQDDKKGYAQSEKGVDDFRASAKVMFDRMAAEAKNIGSTRVKISLKDLPDDTKLVHGSGAYLTLYVKSHYRNSLEGAELLAKFWDNIPRGLSGVMPGFNDGKMLRDMKFRFELQANGHPAFVDAAGRAYSADDLASHLLTEYMNASEKLRKARG